MVAYKNPGLIEFDATIQRADVTGSSAFVTFPFDVLGLFGVKGRVPVVAHFDGIEYRGSLVRYGGPHLILVLTAIQKQLAKGPGDSVHVTIELDESPRVVDLAEDVGEALTNAGVLDVFRDYSYSHQREYHQWIEEAKRPETRASRIAKAAVMIAEGKRLR